MKHGINMNDAQYLKSIRKALHLTQAEMAQKLGYSGQVSVSNIETGKRELSGPARKCLEYIAELNDIRI